GGFRETFLENFTVLEHNSVLRLFSHFLAALIGEADRFMPRPPEGWYRTRIRAALADLRYLQGFLADLGDDSATDIPGDGESLARVVRRKAVALGKIADAIERGLEEVVEE